MRQEKEIRAKIIQRQDIKLSLFADWIVYVEKPAGLLDESLQK